MIERATWLATRSVLSPSRPTETATAMLGIMLIMRVTSRRFHGLFRYDQLGCSLSETEAHLIVQWRKPSDTT